MVPGEAATGVANDAISDGIRFALRGPGDRFELSIPTRPGHDIPPLLRLVESSLCGSKKSMRTLSDSGNQSLLTLLGKALTLFRYSSASALFFFLSRVFGLFLQC